MRPLAPIATVENCEQLFRDALADKSWLQYRENAKTRKHGCVDFTSVATVVSVFDGLSPENKVKLIRMTGGHCGKVALLVWRLIGKVKNAP